MLRQYGDGVTCSAPAYLPFLGEQQVVAQRSYPIVSSSLEPIYRPGFTISKPVRDRGGSGNTDRFRAHPWEVKSPLLEVYYDLFEAFKVFIENAVKLHTKLN